MRLSPILQRVAGMATTMRVPSIFRQEPILWPMLLLLLAVYIIPHTPVPGRMKTEVLAHYNSLPDLRLDFHPTRTFKNRFSTNRTALYIETRSDVGHVTPLLLHMTQVIPPEWRFVFIGSSELVHKVNQSSPVRRMVDIGKLRLGSIERWTDNWKQGQPDISEVHSRLLTNLTFYDEQFPSVEWLLVFRSSAIICANADRTVNDYLEYDWVGAPWSSTDKFGGNGGLSLRRLSRVREILTFQERQANTASEDRWLSSRIGLLPHANPANASVEQRFSVEDIWAERPLGYHVNPVLGPGKSEEVWGSLERRKKVFEYCPEVKIVMNMRLERERCPPDAETDPDSGVEGHKTTTGKRSVREHDRSHQHAKRRAMDAPVVDAVQSVMSPQESPEEIVQEVLEARLSTKRDL